MERLRQQSIGDHAVPGCGLITCPNVSACSVGGGLNGVSEGIDRG